MNRWTDINLGLNVFALGGDSNFAGQVWTTLRQVGESYYSLTGIKLGRRVSWLPWRDTTLLQDFRDLYYDYPTRGFSPAVFYLAGLENVNKDTGAVGEARGEFATIAGLYAQNQAVLAMEIGHLLGLRHTARGFMSQGAIGAGESMRTINRSQRRTMRRNAWLWGA